MKNEVIITAALTGSRPTKDMNPAVPYTPKEIVESAVDCYKAGAAAVHIHVRDPDTGRPDFRIELFKQVLEGIRERCDILVNLTTSAMHLKGPDIINQRLQPVTLKPDLCSFDLGSINFVDQAFINPPEWGRIGAKFMKEEGVKPEIEIFDVGHIYQASQYINENFIDAPPYFQLCMGVRWGIEATPENLLFMKNKLPKNSQWSVLGVGKSQLPMITMALITGGHVRVGFEDNLYLKKGILAKSNAQVVERTVSLAEMLNRKIASPAIARKILNL